MNGAYSIATAAALLAQQYELPNADSIGGPMGLCCGPGGTQPMTAAEVRALRYDDNCRPRGCTEPGGGIAPGPPKDRQGRPCVPKRMTRKLREEVAHAFEVEAHNTSSRKERARLMATAADVRAGRVPQSVDNPDFHRGDRVAGELDSTAALHYMLQVDEAARALDDDITKQTAPGAAPNMVGQSFLGPWFMFMYGAPNADEEADEFPTGWVSWFRDHSSMGTRLLHADAITRRTGEYERRLIELYQRFVALGGQPGQPEPKPGYEAVANDDDTPESLLKKAGSGVSSLINTGLFVAGLFGVGYLLRGARR